MTTIYNLVEDFLAQTVIAVVGVSDKRETGANLNYRTFRQRGYRVYAVNPRMSTFDGAPCYPDLKSIPEKPDAVFILTSPRVTDQVIRQCVELGIKHVWMHCQMGTKPGLSRRSTSVSPSAVELCRKNGTAVIPGSCPAQFLQADLGHALMRRLWGWFGYLNVNDPLL
ncbi:MAG TPA: CoA-binding protein [Candidatus Binatia bacterium]|jgi:predicted CoA-binding protein|nr:CoA-binding protein [Candidatus Binatia bacterium]